MLSVGRLGMVCVELEHIECEVGFEASRASQGNVGR
jgi:hypothetical protein